MDAGRGLAALIVLEHHTMIYFGDRVREVLGPLPVQILEFLSSLNSQAVQFFFFISGWAIFLSLGQAKAADGKIDWRVFAWHRCRRILPIYWLALLFSWMIFVPEGVRAVSTSPANLLGNIAFLQTPQLLDGWFVPYAGDGPVWSLAFEAWYYAATPLLCLTAFSCAGLISRPQIMCISQDLI